MSDSTISQDILNYDEYTWIGQRNGMSSATVIDITNQKHELERKIANLIEEFSSKNSVTVEDISVRHVPMMNQQGDMLNKFYSVELRVWL